MLHDIYHDILIDHSQYSPYRYAQTCRKEHAHNPACGDDVTMWMDIKDDVVQSMSFEGQGCVISQASASLACLGLIGLGVDAACARVQVMLAMLTDTGGDIEVEELRALADIKRFPMRVKCATMAWHTCLKLLRTQGDV